jgi:hypothetical protein
MGKQVIRGNMLVDVRIVPVYDVICRYQPQRAGMAGIYPHLNACEPFIWLMLEGSAELAQNIATDAGGQIQTIENGWFEIRVPVQ